MNTKAIYNLLKLKGLKNETEILYKKTAKQFKREFGIDLNGAPIIFVKHGSIWKLNHTTYVHNGRTFESAQYLPIVSCANKFKALEIAGIQTCWDEGVENGYINLQ